MSSNITSEKKEEEQEGEEEGEVEEEEKKEPVTIKIGETGISISYIEITDLEGLERAKRILSTFRKYIFFDLEGKIRRKEQLAYIQIGGGKGPVVLFNMYYLLKNCHEETIEYLKRILESRRLRKIVFDCRSDSECLYHQLGITLRNVLDLQIFHQGLDRACGKYRLTKTGTGGRGRVLKSMKKIVHEYCPELRDHEFESLKYFDEKWLEGNNMQCQKAKEYSALDIFFVKRIYSGMLAKKKLVNMSEKIFKKVKDGSKKRLSVFRNLEVDSKTLDLKFRTFEIPI